MNLPDPQDLGGFCDLTLNRTRSLVILRLSQTLAEELYASVLNEVLSEVHSRTHRAKEGYWDALYDFDRDESS